MITHPEDARAWLPIESAPLDSTHIIVRTPDGSSFRAAYVPGFLDSSDNDCWAWVALSDFHPDDWTDGTCWEVNEDGNASQQPTHWMPIGGEHPAFARPIPSGDNND